MYFGDDGSFSATVGCNQIGGSVTANTDGTFTVTDLLSTKMFCEELNAAETTFSEILLGGALTFSQTEAGLVAQNSVGTLELAEAMYDAMPINGEERANIGGVGASSDLSALLIAIALLDTSLLDRMRRPTGNARQRERCWEEIWNKANTLQHGGGVELNVRLHRAAWLHLFKDLEDLLLGADGELEPGWPRWHRFGNFP
jgi:hypothetical protein